TSDEVVFARSTDYSCPERDRLQHAAEANIKHPGGLQKFRDDMEFFEKRAAEAKPPLSQEEVAETYRHMARLMEDSTLEPLNQASRTAIAEQAMSQAARPNTIDQGGHSTCNVASVESRMYTRNPADAVRLVADMATTGKYVAADGTVVELDKSNLL